KARGAEKAKSCRSSLIGAVRLARPASAGDYLGGNGAAAARGYGVDHADAAELRCAPSRVAPAPAHESAFARERGRNFDAAFELHRNRPRGAVARHGAAAGRAAAAA